MRDRYRQLAPTREREQARDHESLSKRLAMKSRAEEASRLMTRYANSSRKSEDRPQKYRDADSDLEADRRDDDRKRSSYRNRSPRNRRAKESTRRSRNGASRCRHRSLSPSSSSSGYSTSEDEQDELYSSSSSSDSYRHTRRSRGRSRRRKEHRKSPSPTNKNHAKKSHNKGRHRHRERRHRHRSPSCSDIDLSSSYSSSSETTATPITRQTYLSHDTAMNSCSKLKQVGKVVRVEDLSDYTDEDHQTLNTQEITEFEAYMQKHSNKSRRFIYHSDTDGSSAIYSLALENSTNEGRDGYDDEEEESNGSAADTSPAHQPTSVFGSCFCPNDDILSIQESYGGLRDGEILIAAASSLTTKHTIFKDYREKEAADMLRDVPVEHNESNESREEDDDEGVPFCRRGNCEQPEDDEESEENEDYDNVWTGIQYSMIERVESGMDKHEESEVSGHRGGASFVGSSQGTGKRADDLLSLKGKGFDSFWKMMTWENDKEEEDDDDEEEEDESSSSSSSESAPEVPDVVSFTSDNTFKSQPTAMSVVVWKRSQSMEKCDIPTGACTLDSDCAEAIAQKAGRDNILTQFKKGDAGDEEESSIDGQDQRWINIKGSVEQKEADDGDEVLLNFGSVTNDKAEINEDLAEAAFVGHATKSTFEAANYQSATTHLINTKGENSDAVPSQSCTEEPFQSHTGKASESIGRTPHGDCEDYCTLVLGENVEVSFISEIETGNGDTGFLVYLKLTNEPLSEEGRLTVEKYLRKFKFDASQYPQNWQSLNEMATHVIDDGKVVLVADVVLEHGLSTTGDEGSLRPYRLIIEETASIFMGNLCQLSEASYYCLDAKKKQHITKNMQTPAISRLKKDNKSPHSAHMYACRSAVEDSVAQFMFCVRMEDSPLGLEHHDMDLENSLGPAASRGNAIIDSSATPFPAGLGAPQPATDDGGFVEDSIEKATEKPESPNISPYETKPADKQFTSNLTQILDAVGTPRYLRGKSRAEVSSLIRRQPKLSTHDAADITSNNAGSTKTLVHEDSASELSCKQTSSKAESTPIKLEPEAKEIAVSGVAASIEFVGKKSDPVIDVVASKSENKLSRKIDESSKGEELPDSQQSSKKKDALTGVEGQPALELQATDCSSNSQLPRRSGESEVADSFRALEVCKSTESDTGADSVERAQSFDAIQNESEGQDDIMFPSEDRIVKEARDILNLHNLPEKPDIGMSVKGDDTMRKQRRRDNFIGRSLPAFPQAMHTQQVHEANSCEKPVVASDNNYGNITFKSSTQKSAESTEQRLLLSYEQRFRLSQSLLQPDGSYRKDRSVFRFNKSQLVNAMRHRRRAATASKPVPVKHQKHNEDQGSVSEGSDEFFDAQMSSTP